MLDELAKALQDVVAVLAGWPKIEVRCKLAAVLAGWPKDEVVPVLVGWPQILKLACCARWLAKD